MHYFSKIILKYLVDSCGEGSYKIIDTSELLECLPAKVKATPQSVNDTIKHLENSGYISVKYSDSDQFCLSPRPFGRQVIENETSAKTKNKTYLFAIVCFLCAFFGAFLGTLLSSII